MPRSGVMSVGPGCCVCHDPRGEIVDGRHVFCRQCVGCGRAVDGRYKFVGPDGWHASCRPK